jgi:hypothetical protein
MVNYLSNKNILLKIYLYLNILDQGKAVKES